MDVKSAVNSKINWKCDGSKKHSATETVMQARTHYFVMLRRLLLALDKCKTNAQIQKVFKQYNVYFAEVDRFPRVNIDEPVTPVV